MVKRPSNPVTNEEVAIVRNLLGRDGAKGQTIHGQINARRRQQNISEINAARISEINTGHERYAGIDAASDDEVQAFFETANNVSPVTLQEPSKVGESTLRALLPLRKGTTDILAINETDTIEYKESFATNFFSNCVRTINAFANNRGGYIIFGVTDRELKVVGINKANFNKFDRAKLTNAISDCMSSGIRFEMGTFGIAAVALGALYVHPATIRPVIFITRKDNINKGDIYYRYSGANRKIGSTELQQIIEQRATSLSQSVLGKHLSNIVANGIENSAILNLSTGVVDGKGGSFAIDKKVLSGVDFVKEGQFIEVSGKPTLTVVGEVKNVMVGNLDRWPFNYQSVWNEIKTQVPRIKKNQFNYLIKSHKLKEKREYAGCRYLNPAKQTNFDKNGVVTQGGTYIYNQSAIDFLVAKANELVHPGK